MLGDFRSRSDRGVAMSAPVLAQGLVLGLGASLIMDIWAVLRQRITGANMLDYGWLMRWAAGLPAGRFSLSPGREGPLLTWERVLGWGLHYVIGMGYGVGFLWIVGAGWVLSPSLASALIFGVASSLAPFLILQPQWGVDYSLPPRPSPGTRGFRRFSTILCLARGSMSWR